ISNQYFASLDFGYFADDTSIMPLLHTWSLSIEWQWYFLLPFLLLLLIKGFNVKALPWVLLTGFVFLAYLSIKSSNTPEHLRYYAFEMRCFALLAGALVAIMPYKAVADKLPRWLNTILSLISLSLLLHLGMIGEPIAYYPNTYCLVVVLSSTLLIVLGSAKRKTFVCKFMSFKPFVLTGLISYSLYSWHWPIFAIGRYKSVYVGADKIALLIVISVLVAIVSYKFIENPLRKLHKRVPLMATLAILVLIPILLVYHFDIWATKRMGMLELSSNAVKATGYGCHGKPISTDLAQCVFGDTEKQPSVLVMGDSWSYHATGFVNVLLQDAKMAGLGLTDGSITQFFNATQKGREAIRDRDLAVIASGKYKYVVMANPFARYLSGYHPIYNGDFKGSYEELFSWAFGSTVDFIIEHGATPVFITGVYDLHEDNPYSPNHSGYKYDYSRCGLGNNAFQCSFEDNMMTDPYELKIQALLASFKEKYPQIIIIDLHELLCQDGRCTAMIDDQPLYTDKFGHITHYASHRLGEMYLENIGNPIIFDQLNGILDE
ncbi:MAG: acyltransferase, partial [Deferribacteraceae bacterium]|nr:acyltransferase [Deferribacteraceae bacterium]